MPTWPRRSSPIEFNSAVCKPFQTSSGVRGESKQAASAASRGAQAAQTRVDELGLASETKAEHLARHEGGRPETCARCRYYQRGGTWTRAYGFVAESSLAGPCRRVAWLAERPVRWGGTWALGCTMCADLLSRQTFGESDKKSRRARQRTVWARFEVRPATLQAEHIRQHQNYDLHRLAVQAWLRPDAPLRLSLTAALGDDALLAKHVPQPEDWLLRWK